MESETHHIYFSYSFDEVSIFWRFFGKEYATMMFVIWQVSSLVATEKGRELFATFFSFFCFYLVDGRGGGHPGFEPAGLHDPCFFSAALSCVSHVVAVRVLLPLLQSLPPPPFPIPCHSRRSNWRFRLRSLP